MTTMVSSVFARRLSLGFARMERDDERQRADGQIAMRRDQPRRTTMSCGMASQEFALAGD
jgi:hypothetical protein